jgi:hypothetical protein
LPTGRWSIEVDRRLCPCEAAGSARRDVGLDPRDGLLFRGWDAPVDDPTAGYRVVFGAYRDKSTRGDGHPSSGEAGSGARVVQLTIVVGRDSGVKASPASSSNPPGRSAAPAEAGKAQQPDPQTFPVDWASAANSADRMPRASVIRSPRVRRGLVMSSRRISGIASQKTLDASVVALGRYVNAPGVTRATRGTGCGKGNGREAGVVQSWCSQRKDQLGLTGCQARSERAQQPYLACGLVAFLCPGTGAA